MISIISLSRAFKLSSIRKKVLIFLSAFLLLCHVCVSFTAGHFKSSLLTRVQRPSTFSTGSKPVLAVGRENAVSPESLSKATINKSAPIKTAVTRIFPTETNSSVCADHQKNITDILIVLKTGATEIYEKLPVHLITTLSCHPNYLIFSDYEQRFGHEHVLDALINVSETFKDTHPDFQHYHQIAEYMRTGQQVSDLKGEASWSLDRWKFLPMAITAYHARPDTKWFVFFEADTFVNWRNLRQLLSRLPDPESKSMYLGNRIDTEPVAFAHGGSGFIISISAIRRLSILMQKGKEKFENEASQYCCGDRVLANALINLRIHLTSMSPMIQGETTSSLKMTKSHWCRPAISWHHLKPYEIDALWHFEQSWQISESRPSLFADHFRHFIAPMLTDEIEYWDNFSSDIVLSGMTLYKLPSDLTTAFAIMAYQSLENCRDACLQVDRCLQYVYEPAKCRLGESIALGKSKELAITEDEKPEFVSGWMLDRIDRFVKEAEGGNGCHESKIWNFSYMQDIY